MKKAEAWSSCWEMQHRLRTHRMGRSDLLSRALPELSLVVRNLNAMVDNARAHGNGHQVRPVQEALDRVTDDLAMIRTHGRSFGDLALSVAMEEALDHALEALVLFDEIDQIDTISEQRWQLGSI